MHVLATYNRYELYLCIITLHVIVYYSGGIDLFTSKCMVSMTPYFFGAVAMSVPTREEQPCGSRDYFLQPLPASAQEREEHPPPHCSMNYLLGALPVSTQARGGEQPHGPVSYYLRPLPIPGMGREEQPRDSADDSPSAVPEPTHGREKQPRGSVDSGISSEPDLNAINNQ